MAMNVFIGNDIICINKESYENNFQNSLQYYNRISSSKERLLMSSKYNILIRTHIIFSIKEAAYKVMLKLGFQKAFSPRKFLIESIETTNHDGHLIARGVIKYGIQELFFQSFCNKSYSHSIASSRKISFDKVDVDIQTYKNLNPDNQTQTAKGQLIKHLHSIIPDCRGINVIKDNVGIPVPVLGKQIIPIEVSLSHDGNYIASVVYNSKESE